MEPPIQDLESIDLVGEREDDGIDLGIVCSGPLDESPDTLARLKEKLSGYIAAAASPSLWDEFPTAAPGPGRILICCNYPISVAAQAHRHCLA